MKRINQIEHREATMEDYLEGRATYTRAWLISGEEIHIFKFISTEPITRKEKIKAKIEDKIDNLIGKINLLLFKIFTILFSPILSILFCIDEKRSKKASKQCGDKPLKLIE